MANYRKLEQGLFIGPQPEAQDLAEARRQGIGTVIDMRVRSETATDNARLVRDSGMAYVNIPVDKAALNERQIDELDEALRMNQGAYLLHCASGARVAMLLSLMRARQHGWTAERTFQEAEAMGFDLRNSAEMAAFIRQVTGS
jgi:uncharacterized protein (TIGR01244 family)